MVAPVSTCGPSVFDVSPVQGAITTAEGPSQRLWGRVRGADGDRKRGSAGSDSNRGGTEPVIVGVGSVAPAAIESEGPAGSGWRGRIEEKNCFSGEKAGMVAPVSKCGPSVFDVSPAQGAIATTEGPGQRLWGPRSRRRSKARGQWGALGGSSAGSDRNCGARGDCGVRGARGDRKRGASGERLEGQDRGKNCFSSEKVKKKIVQKEKRGATRELPRGSTILVLLSPKHV
ncbi:Hypothetical predicted protein [Olea europaea subsp. europaea]|uniref:Uncharacterized protein n=1 Tax=Olea europaea subsp. europaea TaxID=158383 RepID=A0A8S0RR45_OLEEU|nr:Hypothetical predicted protein [Olea europaea subsp. europaea]